jgi:hypothetical protein
MTDSSAIDQISNRESNECQYQCDDTEWINHLFPPLEYEIHDDKKYTRDYSSKIERIFKIPFDHDLTPFNSNNEKYNETNVIDMPIARKNMTSTIDAGFVKNGAIIPAENQAADTVVPNSASDFRWTGFNGPIHIDHTKGSFSVKCIVRCLNSLAKGCNAQ